MLPLIIFYGIVFSILIALGILLFCGKGAFLIAGYNTSSKEEKSRIDKKLLCRFMGKLMFLLAGCWLIISLGGTLHVVLLHVIGIVLFVICIAGAAVYANTSDHRPWKDVDYNGTKNK